MLILADLRSLQDLAYAARGVGSHAASLLRWIRGRPLADGGVVGLVDPTLGPLSLEHASLCDEIRPAFVHHPSDEPAVFLSLSPLTHDSLLPARLLDRPHILPIAVVYDFIPLEFPDRYLAERDPLLAYAAAFKWLEAYRAFLPISAHCGRELSRRLGIEPDRVSVTGVSLRDAFARRVHGQAAPPPRPEAAADETILFVGGGDPRKNLETVVAAHAALVAAGRTELQLVIGGGYPRAWQDRIRQDSHQRCGLATEIRFLGRVGDETLAAWHAHAKATVTASLAEGFSMPVIESIASGGLAVVSDIPVHRELISCPEAIFTPTDARELAAKLGAILGAPSLRQQLRDRQRAVAERFTPDAVGSRFEEAIERHVASFLPTARPAARARRPAIAFVTPFPPNRSGVADYSRECVKALANFVDVDVYTDAHSPAADPAVRAFHPISEAAWLRPDYDVVVAVAGNSHYHTKILELQRRFGGPCIMHDSRLAEWTAWWRGQEHLRALAERSLGRTVTAAETQHWLANPGALPTLFYDELLERTEPLFVHSAGVRAHVSRLYGVDAVLLPFCVYRHFSAAEISVPAKRAAREALGIPPDRTVVITLGIVDAVKSPANCVQAVARAGADIHLYFVGECNAAGREAITSLAASEGIAGRVHFSSDWISEEDYRQFIVAADAAIQLRTHFYGGISGALTDCLSAGLPTVANEDLAAAVEAPDYVARVPDRPKVRQVAEALTLCIENGRDRRAHEELRVRYTRGHSFDAYARRLLTRVLGPSRLWAEADQPPAAVPARPFGRGRLLVDCTYTARSPSASGVHRVVTRSWQEIEALAAKGECKAVQVVVRDGNFVATGAEAALNIDRRDTLLLPDAYWACGEVWPAAERARAAGAATATIVYDLIPLQHPEIYGSDGAAMFRRYLTAVIAHADVIVTISQTVARDLAAALPEFRFPRRGPPIVPWRLGCDLPKAPGDVRPEIHRLFIDRLPDSPYLAVGAIEPRKNHGFILDAFERLWEDPATEHVRLAIAGRPGFKSEPVLRRVKSNPRFGTRLFLLTDLDDAEIDHAYRHARGLVCASLAEGFGLPIVEALRHWQTVIASDLPIHREIGGEACDYFDLGSPERLAERLAELERRHRAGAARPRPAVEPITWDEAVVQLLAAIGEALGRGLLQSNPARRISA